MADPMSESLARVRARLADELHDGIVQQVTALSLAVDNAVLHLAAGDDRAVASALRTARTLADTTAASCRTLIDDLRGTTHA